MQRNDRSKLLTFIVYVFSILNEPEGKALVYEYIQNCDYNNNSQETSEGK